MLRFRTQTLTTQRLLKSLLLAGLLPNLSVAQAYRPTRVYRPVSNQTSYRTALARPTDRPPARFDGDGRVDRHPRSAEYRLDGGDLLAIIVDGILGNFTTAPVHMPSRYGDDVAPSLGYPVPVRADGTVNLPLIDPILVRGLTVAEAQKKISRIYRDKKMLNRKNQVMVSLMRKRTVSMTVIHDEPLHPATLASPNLAYSAYRTPRKLVTSVTLPADQADRLTVLGKAGAAIDLDAEILTLHHSGRRRHRRDAQLPNGAVIESKSAPVDFFYTGGRLPANRLPIPKGGLTVAQAVAMSGGSLGQSPFGASDLYVVRHARGGQQSATRINMRGPGSSARVLPGDALILRQTPNELLTRILTNAAQGVISIRP